MNRFFSGLMIAAGLTLFLTTGLCSLGGVVLLLMGGVRGDPVMLQMMIGGFVAALIGFWIFRRGVARAQRN
jgi:hypothetical protein